jgi:hypothetical protein
MSFAEGVEEDSSLSPLSITGLPREVCVAVWFHEFVIGIVVVKPLLRVVIVPSQKL